VRYFGLTRGLSGQQPPNLSLSSDHIRQAPLESLSLARSESRTRGPEKGTWIGVRPKMTGRLTFTAAPSLALPTPSAAAYVDQSVYWGCAVRVASCEAHDDVTNS
jgi:hypothetical protein